MASTPVAFEQRKIFAENDPLVKNVLGGVQTFAHNTSYILGQLVQFLNVSKFYLQALADPLALILIPAIDALIEALEDLKNIGVGTIGIWPWEVGRVQSGVDATKLEKSIRALIAATAEVDPKKISWSQSQNAFVVNLSKEEVFANQGNMAGTAEILAAEFDFTAEEKITSEQIIKSADRQWLLDILNTVYNYLNPKEWAEQDTVTKKILHELNESFKTRTLTPSQFINELTDSFNDTTDPMRPVGGGDYVAFVGFFALPTHHALRDMMQAFTDFFANVIPNLPDFSDDKIEIIELGHPLVIKDLERNIKTQTGEELAELDDKIDEVSDEILDAMDIADDAGETALIGVYDTEATTTRHRRSIAKLKTQRNTAGKNALSYQNEIKNIDTQLSNQANIIGATQYTSLLNRKTQLQKLYTDAVHDRKVFNQSIRVFRNKIEEAQSDQKHLDENSKTAMNKVSQLQKRKADVINEQDNLRLNGAILKEKFYALNDVTPRNLKQISGTFGPDNAWTVKGVTIPHFKKGELIQQGHVFNDFTAEVVEHLPIVVKDGKIITNRVRIKSKKGNIKKNTAPDGSTPNSPPVISLDGKQLDSFGVIKTGEGIQGARTALLFPMFSSANPDVPEQVEALQFRASLRTGSNFLSFVLPNMDELKQVGTDPSDRQGIYHNSDWLNLSKNRKMMISFVESLSLGSPITHNFIGYDLSEWDPPDADINPFNRLAWSLFPGLGNQPCIGKVFIGANELKKGDIESQLFEVSKTRGDKEIVYTEMNTISIRIGRYVSDGVIDPYYEKHIVVPGKVKMSFDNDNPSFSLHNMGQSLSSLPNWKFTRIQDMFPIYGRVIDRIIDKLNFAKDFASGQLEDLNRFIQSLEDLVEDLEKLNADIQKLLQFFIEGFSKSGFYTAQFAGSGGVKDFKSKLVSAKIKNANANPFPKFELKPVTTTVSRRNPSTNEDEEIETTVLQMVSETPSQEEFDALPKNSRGEVEELISISELDSLKYSGGFCMFAIGNDTSLLEKFLVTSGIKKAEEQLITENFVSDTGINEAEQVNALMDNLKPYVQSIQTQNIGSDDYVASEQNSNVRKDTGIKVVFANDASQLTDAEKEIIKSAKGDNFIFEPNIQYGSIIPATDKDFEKVGGNVILSNDDFTNGVPLSFSVNPVKTTVNVGTVDEPNEIQVVNAVIINPSTKLDALTNYKLKLKTSILSNNQTSLREEFVSEFGFTTTSTTVFNIDIG